MNSGLPPTAPNARAGLFTPPGMTRLARSNAAALFARSGEFCGMLGSCRVGQGSAPSHRAQDGGTAQSLVPPYKVTKTRSRLRNQCGDLAGALDLRLDLRFRVVVVQFGHVAAAVAHLAALRAAVGVAPEFLGHLLGRVQPPLDPLDARAGHV